MGETVLIVGSGGREHALAWKLAQSPAPERLLVAPGNAGTAAVAENVPVAADRVDEIASFAKANGVTLVVIGPDEPLALGLADRCQERGIAVFGPSRAAAMIEWSKAFAKSLFGTLRIPTPAAEICSHADHVRAVVARKTYPLVLKASGLARGKGVFICWSLEDVETALRKIAALKTINNERTILVEEFVDGVEFSLHALTDGTTVLPFPIAQDHKALGDGGMGPMTGGMGVVAPVPYLPEHVVHGLHERITERLVTRLAGYGTPFCGTLYPGIIVNEGGPKLLEANARFGDPEAQAYLRLMASDLLQLLRSCANGTLDGHTLEWQSGYVCSVALVSAGYGLSDEFETGFPISGIEDAERIPGVVVFHGSTKRRKDDALVTAGGRVLHVTAVGATLAEAVERAYAAAELIRFHGKTLRTDIGAHALTHDRES